MLFKLAWKNIWRNKKRTLIVAGSVFFAVILACTWRSGQIGSFDYMIHSIAKMHLGFLQIQHRDYQENRSLDDSFIMDEKKLADLGQLPHITSLSPRIESFALISKDTLTKVAQIIGIDPEAENMLSNLSAKMQDGIYLDNKSKGALIGSSLARNLKLNLGDTLFIYGMGFHGQTAATLLPIQGILHFSIENLNRQMVYINQAEAAQLFSMDNRFTSVAVMIDKLVNLEMVSESISKQLSTEQVVKTWDELMPEIKQTITIKTSSNYILIAILYIVIAFGIFGVIMMMTVEREKEFGVLHALGMKKRKMIFTTILESLFIASLGAIAGILGALPIILTLAANPIRITGELAKSWDQMGIEPIMTFSAAPGIFLYQALIVFIITMICVIYPALFLSKLDIVKALKK